METLIKNVMEGKVESEIISKCTFCGGTKMYGLCLKCGFADVCSICNCVIQPNKKPRRMGYDIRKASHGYCSECYPIALEEAIMAGISCQQ